jgi:hypothetical protein
MVRRFGPGVARLLKWLGATLRRAALAFLAPASKPTGIATGYVADLLRTPGELRAENAFLRQQILIAARRSKKLQLRTPDRFCLLALAHRFSRRRDALVIVKPDTLLRWHRGGFRLLWRLRSRRKSPSPPGLPIEVVGLIRRMAGENRLWDAERIRGELLKLGITVAKRTIQRHMSKVRTTPPDGQPWSAFLRQQAAGIWACDFVEVRDLWFRCHYVLVVIHLETRQILHATSTLAPTAAWTI